jgi:Protein of unknown function (DUF2961)
MTGPLSDLPRIIDASSHRISSWDRTGGNRDFMTIPAGATVEIASIERPGVIRHVWVTSHSRDKLYLRKAVLRAYWDGEPDPSIEVPLGDFFGMGHARTANFWSLPLQMSPEDGRAFNCWFPMPFDAARLTVQNEADADVVLYFYIDYELSDARSAETGRFHAQWRRQNPCAGIDESGLTNEAFLGEGINLDGAGNYLILEAVGRGHYVGCCLSIDNRRDVGIDTFNWYGEGDDMIFVDGEPFPPSLHGTGTEDYFNTAFCPTEAYSSPYHGIILPGGRNWRGKLSLFRFHIDDAVRFRTSIRVTIEHGHANRRSDDYASTAYWYQLEPHAPFPDLPPVLDRLPSPDLG